MSIQGDSCKSVMLSGNDGGRRNNNFDTSHYGSQMPLTQDTGCCK